MSFNKTPRHKAIAQTAGPGEYDTDRAQRMTKSRSQATIMKKGKARPDNFTKAQDSAAPG